MAKEKCAKESQRHGDSRGGPPRFALFANIGVPGTAVPGSCICSGLPVANCLRQLCPLGTRSLSAQASVCGSPSGCPRARGVRCRIAPCRSLCSPPTLPAGRFGLRPRPHWGHASLRDSSLRSPAGKKALIAHFDGGARNVARNEVDRLSHTGGARSCSPISAVKIGGPFSLRCLSPLGSPTVGVGHTQMAMLGMIRRGAADFAR